MSELPERTVKALTEGRHGFEHYEDGSFAAAVGPVAVDLFRLIVIENALAFEVKHPGMKMTRHSTLKAANSVLGTNYRRKAQALDHLRAVMAAARGEGVES